ncbi:hypothetical protein AAEX63_02665 [Luteococcus sp. H138]|uniref:hypothetical protein n=1 Tax=Luteococcus sp. H138 TaxID=3139404 RepID=UPI00313DDCA6
MTPEGSKLLTAVALALTGELPAIPLCADSTDELVAALAELGWDAARVQELRRRCQGDEEPWPFPVPRDVLVAVGFARYAAVLSQVRGRLGVDGLVGTIRRGPTVIGPAEQRLLAERPPHHGPVG